MYTQLSFEIKGAKACTKLVSNSYMSLKCLKTNKITLHVVCHSHNWKTIQIAYLAILLS